MINSAKMSISTSWNIKLFVLIIVMMECIFAYKKVILIPGILSARKNMEGLKDMIQKTHKGTNVTIIDIYPEVESFVPLNIQLAHWREKIRNIMDESPAGVHLVCHSQGGLICQGIIQTVDHNVDTFIALSSPLYGQFGVPDIILEYIPWLRGFLREDLTKFMYTVFTQITFSISNFWKDPRNGYEEEYLSVSHYLPYVLNHPKFDKMTLQEKADRKKKFLKLKHVVLVGGPDDGVIEPWESSLYGYYGNDYQIVNYDHQPVYTDDWFGLRTLNDDDRLHMYIMSGVKHVDWHNNATVFKTAIEPWLT